MSRERWSIYAYECMKSRGASSSVSLFIGCFKFMSTSNGSDKYFVGGGQSAQDRRNVSLYNRASFTDLYVVQEDEVHIDELIVLFF